MRVNRNVRAAATAAALVWGSSVAAEDLTIVSKVTSSKGAPGAATTYLSSGKFRHSDGGHDSIMDLSTGKLVTIDHGRKEYWETTLDEMRAAMEKADAQMKQMQEQMKQNPQAAALMQRMMGGIAAEATVQKGAAPRQIAGYDCDQYIISIGDAVRVDMWVTTALQPPTQMYDLRRAMAPPSGPMAQNFAKLFDEMRKIKGYALAEATTIKIMGAGTTTSTEATEVRKGPIPASAFDVAAVAPGYKKAEAPFKKMAQ